MLPSPPKTPTPGHGSASAWSASCGPKVWLVRTVAAASCSRMRPGIVFVRTFHAQSVIADTFMHWDDEHGSSLRSNQVLTFLDHRANMTVRLWHDIWNHHAHSL